MQKMTIASAAVVVAFGASSTAIAANNMGIYYYETPTVSTGDFGPCCSSPPATSPGITPDALLGPDGLPVNQGNVIDVNGSKEILWWSPGVESPNPITFTGSGVFSVGTVASPDSSTMYAPNSTGTDDSTNFETAYLWGTILGTGADVTLHVSSDDDTLVYLNGSFVGGNQGVHGVEAMDFDLGLLSGANTLQIFYADRAQTGAELNLGIDGASISGVPELSTWVIMGLGFAGLGFAASRRASKPAPSVA